MESTPPKNFTGSTLRQRSAISSPMTPSISWMPLPAVSGAYFRTSTAAAATIAAPTSPATRIVRNPESENVAAITA